MKRTILLWLLAFPALCLSQTGIHGSLMYRWDKILLTSHGKNLVLSTDSGKTPHLSIDSLTGMVSIRKLSLTHLSEQKQPKLVYYNPLTKALSFGDTLSGGSTGSTGTATDHNSLTGLQGGATGERYHLSGAELLATQSIATKVSSVSASLPIVSSGGTSPVLSLSSDTSALWQLKMSRGSAAFLWGNHALGGYLKSYSETDPRWLSDSSGFLRKADTAARLATRRWTSDNYATRASPLFSGTVTAQQVAFEALPVQNNTASGSTITLTAATAQGPGDVVYINALGKAALCRADAIATCPYALAVCTQALSANSQGVYLTRGAIRNDAWDWAPGGLVYVSTLGTTGNTLTQAMPSSPDQVIMAVGVALSPDVVYFIPNLTSIEYK